jgi:hypothetical protein
VTRPTRPLSAAGAWPDPPQVPQGPRPEPLPGPGAPRTWPATASTAAAAKLRALHPATDWPAMPAGWYADPGPITVPLSPCCGAQPGDRHDGCWGWAGATTYVDFDQPMTPPPHAGLTPAVDR